ncbi:MAG: ECF transporter S component [Clostridia bacterium]
MVHKRNQKLYGVVFTGLMAAMVFVATMFLKIEIPTPTGPTMLKVGNIVCLLGGMLFGGVYGGLAAGIGSALYDLTNPVFAPEAWITLIRFFMTGFLTGVIAHGFGKKGADMKMNLLAATCGSLFNWLFYVVKSVGVLMVAGSAFYPALIGSSVKMATSGINAVIAVVCAMLLIKPLNLALRRAGMLEKIGK